MQTHSVNQLCAYQSPNYILALHVTTLSSCIFLVPEHFEDFYRLI